MIYAMHGVVSGAISTRFTHRNMSDRDAFAQHLSGRAERYVSLRDAIAGLGDALTIDDATAAGADAARMARELGHPVTMFVNGLHIAEGLPYWFSRLFTCMEASTLAAVVLGDIVLSPRTEAFVQAVKEKMSRIPTEDGRQALMTKIARTLGPSEPAVPAHLEVLSLETMRELDRLGVSFQNHGWTHAHAEALTPEQHEREIAQGRAYVREHSSSEGELYAVPYGYDLPRIPPKHCDAWLRLVSPAGPPRGIVIDRAPL